MSNSTLKMLPALMVAITAALVTQPVNGQTPTPTPVITFTENSSTSLTATYNNGAGVMTTLVVSPFVAGGDSWQISTVNTPLSGIGISGGVLWSEPEPPLLFNGLDFGQFGFIVTSDIPDNPFSQFRFANNAISTIPIAHDLSNPSAPVNVYGVFNDLGDTATVPDTGTTFSLLGLSLMGLAFLRRKLC